ncbi:MAG: LamG-like jellyroll fold domain-containing protein, partial [Vicinamibacterales bacterium]
MGRWTKRSTRRHIGAVLAAVLLAPLVRGLVADQGGGQFLDGIGETALVARYLFNGSAEDSSRNHLHATLQGSGAAFVADERFGRVLELAGSGSFVQLPGQALAGEDAVSVTGWIYLPTGALGPIFDVGHGASNRLFASVSAASGFSAGVAAGGMRLGTEPAPVSVNQWMHVAVVFDPPNGRLAAYLNGARAGQAAAAGITVAQLIRQGAGGENRLYIGRAQDDAATTFHGKLRDVRLYRVALTDAQVAAINGAASGRQSGRGRGGTPPPEISAAAIPKQSPLASRLERVPDIQAETVVGRLPRLSREIPAVYRDRAEGPKVRVVWPAPKDNLQVARPGTYTVTGKVPGTPFEPKATVVVKPAGKPEPAPARTL